MAPASPYNVAILVVDDLRADHLKAWGYDRDTAPELDRRLSDGTVFTRCHTPTGWTLPACASIITGHAPDDHRLVDHNQRFEKKKLGHYLPESYHRIAFTNNGNTIPDSVPVEVLESMGLERRPAKWKFFGWDDGFDEFIWTPREDHLSPFDRAATFLRERRRRPDEPYFLFFHTNLVHDYHLDRDYYHEVHDWLGRGVHPKLREFRDGPWIWQSPPEGLTRDDLREDLIGKYDSGIRATDALLARLFDEIDMERTIVVLLGDHGEGFDADVGRVHHCGRLHEDLLHVPLALWLPRPLREQTGLPARETRQCSTLDVVPTVLTLLGRVPDELPGRVLNDLSNHRRVDGSDRGYLYWNEDCLRESYDTCRIEISSRLTYPLKQIEVCRNDSVRRYEYNLAYDPQERDNLLDRHGKDVAVLEPVSFVVAVNDWAELEENLLASPVARSPRHQWILVDNCDNRFYASISRLYHEAAGDAVNDLVFYMHQDLYLPAGWEERTARALQELETLDPTWGVVGGVGAIKAHENIGAPKVLKGHWCDPHGYHCEGPLPHEVEALDEQWLGLRRSRGFGFDPDLPGFHCYGIDLSLTAREAGSRSWAIDSFVWHKFRDEAGNLIGDPAASRKIRGRWDDAFMQDFQPAAEFVERKWSKFLPFQTTSWTWR